VLLFWINDRPGFNSGVVGGGLAGGCCSDIASHTQAKITVTSRKPSCWNGSQCQLLGPRAAAFGFGGWIREECDRQPTLWSTLVLVLFTSRTPMSLKICIEHGVNYLDVSDHPSFTLKCPAYKSATAGVTAIVNTGIFQAFLNSMVRQGVEQPDRRNVFIWVILCLALVVLVDGDANHIF